MFAADIDRIATERYLERMECIPEILIVHRLGKTCRCEGFDDVFRRDESELLDWQSCSQSLFVELID